MLYLWYFCPYISLGGTQWNNINDISYLEWLTKQFLMWAVFWCLNVWILQGAPASSSPAVSIPVFRSHALPAGYGALSSGKPPNTRHFPYSEMVCLPFRIYTSGQQPFEIKWLVILIIIQCIEADTLVSHDFKMVLTDPSLETLAI